MIINLRKDTENMSVLSNLEPKAVFTFFEELCAIPHGSGHTKAISDYLAAFGRARGLETHQDAANNVIIKAPGTPGYEQSAPVIVQGHMDMVCAKAPDCAKDMEREGLELAVEGDTVLARRRRRHRRGDGAGAARREGSAPSADRGRVHRR